MINIEKFKLEENSKNSVFSWDKLIHEDRRNNYIIEFDEDIFTNSTIFKVSKHEDIMIDGEEKEKKRKEEEKRKEYEKNLKRIEDLTKEIESNTFQIKIDMEENEKKREEIEKQKKLEEERRQIEIERQKKIEEERRRKLEEEEKKKEEELRKMQAKNKDDNGKNIKERLINAANNFENIRNEIKEINKNKNLTKITNNIFKSVSEYISKTIVISQVNDAIKSIRKLFDEIKAKDNNKELHLYACHTILSKIKTILTSSEINFKDIFIKSKIIFMTQSKTLTYLFYQNMAYLCPFIIPVKKSMNNHQGIRDENIINEDYNQYSIIEYLYFSFLFLDINNNINILEEFIKGMEAFPQNDFNYLLSKAFLCFIDVFGNYIKKNKNEWMKRILSISNKAKTALENEKKKERGIKKSLVDKIYLDLENILMSIQRDNDTNYISEIKKVK